MNLLNYKFNEKEMSAILDSLVIIVDSREKVNQHVLDYFRKKEVPYKFQTMKTGDYSAMVPKNDELGIFRDIYLSASIERKNGVDELVGSIKDRTRFENELIRSTRHPFVMIVEDLNGYEKILNGQYVSRYDPKALLGSLKTFEARYGFNTVFIDKKLTGNFIYHHFLYYVRELLKK